MHIKQILVSMEKIFNNTLEVAKHNVLKNQQDAGIKEVNEIVVLCEFIEEAKRVFLEAIKVYLR